MTTCSIDVTEQSYYENIFLLFVREWTRVSAGQAALLDLDNRVKGGKGLNIPADVEKPISDIIEAMFWGEKISGPTVIPGVWREEEDESRCYQDWTKTACFARWFMSQTPDKREQIVQLVKAGDVASWNTLEGNDTSLSPCPAGSPPERTCCPSAVWADPAYLSLGKEPQAKEAGWSWWQLGLAGVGLGVAAVAAKKWIK